MVIRTMWRDATHDLLLDLLALLLRIVGLELVNDGAEIGVVDRIVDRDG